MAQMQFNAQNVAPINMDREPLPTGWYLAQVKDTKIEPTKKQDGTKLVYTLEIIDGPYKGQNVVDSFNLQLPSAEATRIGLGQLSALCHAVGILNLVDSDQLCRIPFKVKIRFDPPEGQYGASNSVVAHKHVSEEVDMTPQPKPVIQQAAAPTNFAAPSGFTPPPATFAAPPASVPAPQYSAPAAPQFNAPPAFSAPPAAQAPQQSFSAPPASPAPAPSQAPSGPAFTPPGTPAGQPPAWAVPK